MGAGSHDSDDFPLVTIVTPSYNQGLFIERTILSVLKQDYPNIEYIIVDAVSTDDTVRILDKYKHQFAKLIVEKDSGQADAINKGFACSRGKIMAYLNSDDCYAGSSVVSQAVDFLSHNPDADLVYGRRMYIDENGKFLRQYPFSPFSKEELYQACYIPQECCFWTKEIYDRAGSYINLDYRFALDYELWFRFLDHHANFVAINSVFGLFREHQDSKTISAWHTIGYPEARRLIKQYTKKDVTMHQMYDVLFQHFFHMCRNKQPLESQVSSLIWDQQLQLSSFLLGGAPLDYWVYQQFTTKTTQHPSFSKQTCNP